MEDPEIAVAILVENGGGGSTTAAPIGKALMDYWMLQREKDPILPPTAAEIKEIRAQKALEKARLEAEQELLAAQAPADPKKKPTE